VEEGRTRTERARKGRKKDVNRRDAENNAKEKRKNRGRRDELARA
jgi:hypothetical protein